MGREKRGRFLGSRGSFAQRLPFVSGNDVRPRPGGGASRPMDGKGGGERGGTAAQLIARLLRRKVVERLKKKNFTEYGRKNFSRSSRWKKILEISPLTLFFNY